VADQPVIAERVSDRAGPFPVELIRGLANDLGPGANRLRDDGIGIVDVKMDAERARRVEARRVDAEFREFI
jgi:hypothetical protein